MLKFNAHLGYLFNEVPFLDRFQAAAEAGFKAVEFPAPYPFDPGLLADRLAEHDLELVQISTPMGPEKGLAAMTGREIEYRAQLAKAADYAQQLGCRHVHLMAGSGPDALTDIETYANNLEFSVRYLADQGLESWIEVISTPEAPEYFLSDFSKAERVLEALPELGLIFDIYHTHLITGNSLAQLQHWIDRVRHVQVADAPGRHEPGTGSLDFAKAFRMLETHGYGGWIGCEYRPATTTHASLSFMEKHIAIL